MPSSGYIEVLDAAKKEKIISHEVYSALKPFFEFRNTLVHKYWQINDHILMKGLKTDCLQFYNFIKEIEGYLKTN